MTDKMKIEKGPGWDWEITYEDDEGIEVMSVFGQRTIEEAIREARYSLTSTEREGEPAFYNAAILSAKRKDKK